MTATILSAETHISKNNEKTSPIFTKVLKPQISNSKVHISELHHFYIVPLQKCYKVMGSQYLPANNDSPETMIVKLEQCSANRIRIENT